MPNWTQNTMEVRGDANVVEDFVKAVATKDEPLDFNKIIPCPRPIRPDQVFSGHITVDGKSYSVWRQKGSKKVPVPESTLKRWKAKYGATCWYDWQADNWGCKWGACGTDFTRNNGREAIYSFNTPWSAPWPIYARLCEVYPDLNIQWSARHEEEGFEKDHHFPHPNSHQFQAFQRQWEKERIAIGQIKANIRG